MLPYYQYLGAKSKRTWIAPIDIVLILFHYSCTCVPMVPGADLKNQSVSLPFQTLAILCFLMGLLLSAATALGQPPPTDHLEKKKIVILFSYEKGWWAVENEHRGIVQGLSALEFREEANLDITCLYMNTKTFNKSARHMEAAAANLLKQIASVGPDVLLIMDEGEIVLEVVGDILQHAGYSVAFARDGREMLDLYREAQSEGTWFDLVILDLSIFGGMGGKEAIGHLMQMDPADTPTTR